jgi:hypothetical protein
MNKISHVDFDLDMPWIFHNENNERLRNLEQLDETYGIKCNVVGGRFEISDQSKFMLFMLKYPEFIEKIVYE